MTHFRIKAVSGKYYITIKGKLAHPMYNQKNVTTFQNEEDLKDENIKKHAGAKLCQAQRSLTLKTTWKIRMTSEIKIT